MPARAPARHHAPPALDTRSPFLRADALAAGLTDKELAGPRFRRIFTAVYIGADVAPHPLHRVAAALLVHPPEAFASHASAARVLNAPVGTPVAGRHRLRISAPKQNFVELAEQLDLVDLVVVGDHYVARGWVTPEDLVAHADKVGNDLARRAARHVRRDVDSPMETRLRMLIVLAGLPEPVVNHKVLTEDGRVRYRFDLSWPEAKVAVEYDGRQHRDDLDQWDHDIARDEWLAGADWVRAHGCPRVPQHLSEEWRPYFPVRS